MRTPLTSGITITPEQLNYVVPFMILKDWRLYCQAVYLSTPQLITDQSWGTRYLVERWCEVLEGFREVWDELERREWQKGWKQENGKGKGKGREKKRL